MNISYPSDLKQFSDTVMVGYGSATLYELNKDILGPESSDRLQIYIIQCDADAYLVVVWSGIHGTYYERNSTLYGKYYSVADFDPGWSNDNRTVTAQLITGIDLKTLRQCVTKTFGSRLRFEWVRSSWFPT